MRAGGGETRSSGGVFMRSAHEEAAGGTLQGIN